jgi:hypothetical protein
MLSVRTTSARSIQSTRPRRIPRYRIFLTSSQPYNFMALRCLVRDSEDFRLRL